MEFNQEVFCHNLKALRIAKRLNRYEVSIQSNIIYQYYCSIEKGVKVPNFKAVISIANALNTDISHLLLNTSNLNNEALLKNAVMSEIKSITDENLLNNFYDFLILLKTQLDVKRYD